jgi:hypothetical protein
MHLKFSLRRTRTMIGKFLIGDEKLFQKLFSLPAFIIITLVIVTILILLHQIPTSPISLLLRLLLHLQQAQEIKSKY